MGADGYDGTLVLQVFDGRDGSTDTSIISDLLSVKRDVDIATNQNLLSLKFGFGQVFDGLLGLQFERGDGSSGTESVCLLKRKRTTKR